MFKCSAERASETDELLFTLGIVRQHAIQKLDVNADDCLTIEFEDNGREVNSLPGKKIKSHRVKHVKIFKIDRKSKIMPYKCLYIEMSFRAFSILDQIPFAN